MEPDKEREFLARCSSHYSTGGMRAFEYFINNYSGNPDEIEFANNVRGLIRLLNSNGRTRITCFSYDSVGQIIEHGICFAKGSDKGLQEKIKEYSRIFSSNLPAQS